MFSKKYNQTRATFFDGGRQFIIHSLFLFLLLPWPQITQASLNRGLSSMTAESGIGGVGVECSPEEAADPGSIPGVNRFYKLVFTSL